MASEHFPFQLMVCVFSYNLLGYHGGHLTFLIRITISTNMIKICLSFDGENVKKAMENVICYLILVIKISFQNCRRNLDVPVDKRHIIYYSGQTFVLLKQSFSIAGSQTATEFGSDLTVKLFKTFIILLKVFLRTKLQLHKFFF